MIKIIKTNIPVESVLKQLKQYSMDWECQKNDENSDSLLNYGFPKIDIGVLQLKVGVVSNSNEFVGDSELSRETTAWNRHTAILTCLRKNGFKKIERCGFLSLPVGKEVGSHIDVGSYYLNRDRYHLSIQGTYLYTCDDQQKVIKPGTLFWFDNKKMHSAKNIGDDIRITFVFDTLKIK
jgi:mannose-6-phosphate isomerase-like protein (cupin superfamily)